MKQLYYTFRLIWDMTPKGWRMYITFLESKVILADESTGNLDSKNGAEVMRLLTALNQQGITIVMVTHAQHNAAFAHRAIHLFDGSIVASITA